MHRAVERQAVGSARAAGRGKLPTRATRAEDARRDQPARRCDGSAPTGAECGDRRAGRRQGGEGPICAATAKAFAVPSLLTALANLARGIFPPRSAELRALWRAVPFNGIGA